MVWPNMGPSELWLPGAPFLLGSLGSNFETFSRPLGCHHPPGTSATSFFLKIKGPGQFPYFIFHWGMLWSEESYLLKLWKIFPLGYKHSVFGFLGLNLVILITDFKKNYTNIFIYLLIYLFYIRGIRWLW